MARIEKKLEKSPYSGNEEMFYSVYRNWVENPDGGEVFVGSTYDENEASDYYDRAVRLEEYYQSKQEEEEALRERDKQDAEELGMDAVNETDENKVGEKVAEETASSPVPENAPQPETSTAETPTGSGNETPASDGSSTPGDAVSGTTDGTMNASDAQQIPQDAIVKKDGELGRAAGIDINMHRNKGTVYPVIRINDAIITEQEIVEFYVESGFFKSYTEYKTIKIPRSGFLPTVHLIINTVSPALLKNDIIKSGDKMAVFMSAGGGMVKSLRCDFVITSVVTTDKPSELTNAPVTYIIDGELWVPNIHSEIDKMAINGTSRDVLMELANKLGLGFFFCDPDNTEDYQGWTQTTSMMDFILDVSSRAWKNFDSFFECWVDTRYGLSFINVNKMLVEDGLDEPLDFTPFVSTIKNGVGVDGAKVDMDEDEKKKKAAPQAKIFSNIPRDDAAATPFFVKRWKVVNRAAEIANEIGINQSQSSTMDNAGVESDAGGFDMQYSIPINKTKLQNGFYVLMGPGVNLTYKQADQVNMNQSFVRSSNTQTGGGISEIMSNDDGQGIEQTGGNSQANGNVNRFYEAGWEHNMRNNLQLQKQYIEVDLMGLNLAIMRGEKIPMMIMDHDKLNSVVPAQAFPGTRAQRVLYESGSGWFVIDSIMWKWDRNEAEHGNTRWTTSCKLVRREWPIPGRNGVVLKED